MTIALQNLLPLYFDSTKALQSEVWRNDLMFNKGEYIKIVAPSGSGKTSLVNFLYGMNEEYAGNILYDNKNIRGISVEEFSPYRKDHISIVFQDLRLFPDQTVLNNIEIKRQLNPYHPPEMITYMTEQLGIRDKLSSFCRTCSYGEKQRVAIIRSLMQPFDFIFLDEPFSHLDNKNAEKAMELIVDECNKRKAGIVLAELERLDYFPNTHLYHL